MRKRHTLEAAAFTERSIPDARHIGRDRHALKAAAVPERVVPNGLHAVRNRHIREHTETESVFPDTRHTVADDDGFDILPFIVPRRFAPDSIGIIRHRPRAAAGVADGEGAVVIQCPGQVFAALTAVRCKVDLGVRAVCSGQVGIGYKTCPHFPRTVIINIREVLAV